MLDFHEIELTAYANSPLPQYTYQYEQACYLCLRSLYHDFRRGYIQREDAQKEKRSIKKIYESSKQDHDRMTAAYQQYQENIRNAGLLLDTICKKAKDPNRDMTELFLLAYQCIAHMTGEMVTYSLIKKYIKKEVI